MTLTAVSVAVLVVCAAASELARDVPGAVVAAAVIVAVAFIAGGQ